MKLPLSTLVLAGALIAGMLVSSGKAQTEVDRPPGVPIENWIAISDSVGIVIRNLPQQQPSTAFRFDRDQPGRLIPIPPNAIEIPLDVQSLPGVLMAKHSGLWIRIDMVPPAQLHPLDL